MEPVTTTADYESPERKRGCLARRWPSLVFYWKMLSIYWRANRIAVRGSVNLWHETYNDIEFALINEEGCAIYKQKISGNFTDPDISEVKVVRTLLAPVKNIFRRKKCKNPFYEGSVKPYQKE